MLPRGRVNFFSVCLSVLIIIFFTERLIRFFLKDKDVDKKVLTVEQKTTLQPTRIYTLPSYIVEEFLEKTRSKIQYQLSCYNFSLSGVRGLEDLVMESGGRPLRSLIISTWKSGTTFLGQILNSIPGTYYHYEPLLKDGVIQIRGPPKANQALKIIKNLLKCNYKALKDYLEFAMKKMVQFQYNTRLWEHCKFMKHLCYDAVSTSRICKLFPFQAMKLVRLRLQLIPEILDDKELNVKVILLVRDPRGVMMSRGQIPNCKNTPDCYKLSHICGDMISDYTAAGRILQQYRNRLMILRYEELALEPYITSHRILKFLQISATQSVEEYLQWHTNVDAGMSHTFRVSRDVPFKWKKALHFSYVNEIQMACKEAMLLWGYQIAHNKTHMKSKDFNPIEQGWRSF